VILGSFVDKETTIGLNTPPHIVSFRWTVRKSR